MCAPKREWCTVNLYCRYNRQHQKDFLLISLIWISPLAPPEPDLGWPEPTITCRICWQKRLRRLAIVKIELPILEGIDGHYWKKTHRSGAAAGCNKRSLGIGQLVLQGTFLPPVTVVIIKAVHVGPAQSLLSLICLCPFMSYSFHVIGNMDV